MTTAQALGYLGLWSAIGCVLFSIYVVIAFRTGIVWTARNEDGLLKERVPASGRLAMLSIPLVILGFQVLANYFGLESQAMELSYWGLFALNFGHYVVLFLYDTIVIDILVLSLWRPGFLKLPDAMGWESMKRHALLSIPIGAAAGLLLTAISTAISYWAFLSR